MRKRGMNRVERFAAASESVAPLAPPIPLQNVVVDDRRLLTVPWVSFFRWILDVGTRIYVEGTHAQRLTDKYSPANFRPGTWFYETDRTVLYQVRIVADEPHWVYVAGTMRNTLANIPMDLTAYDTGFLFYGTDYAHTWRWTWITGPPAHGQWEYAPGDRASGEFAWFASDPGTGWKLCNGTGTTRTNADASTTAFATPNLIGVYPKGGSTYTGGVVSAVGGTVSGTTGSESAHTHTVDPALWITDSPDTGMTVQAGTTANIAALMHKHYVDMPATTSSAGSAHSHDAGTLAVSAGEPQHVDLLPYFRR